MSPPDEAPTNAELGRWMKAIQDETRSGFAQLRGEISDVNGQLRTLGFVRADVYASDRAADAAARVAMEERLSDRVLDIKESGARNWILTWALLATLLAVVGAMAKAFG